MTSKQDFTDEEWTRIRRAPLVAGVAISLADPGGPIEVAKETMATLRSATLPPSQEELLAAVALDVQALAQQRQNPLGDFRPRGGQQVLEELRGVNELVTAKATPQEAEAFRRWLVAAAQAAADAAKEGGFMGFGERRGAADAGPGARRARGELNRQGRAALFHHHVAAPAKPVTGLHAAVGDPGRDAAAPQRPPAARQAGPADPPPTVFKTAMLSWCC
jgi:hypothetical protein